MTMNLRGGAPNPIGCCLLLVGLLVSFPAGASAADTAERARTEAIWQHVNTLQDEIGAAPDPAGEFKARWGEIDALVGDYLDLTVATGRNHENIGERLLSVLGHDPAREKELLARLSASPVDSVRVLAHERGELLTRLRGRAVTFGLESIDGDRIDLAALRGRVVLVTIWGRHCAPCLAAMPRLQAAYEKYRAAGLEVVGICLARDEEEKRRSINLLREKGVTYPNGVLTGGRPQFRQALAEFGWEAYIGIYFLFDRQGRFVTDDISGNWLDHEIRRLLVQQGPAESAGKGGAPE